MRRVETTERDVRDLVCLADEGGVGGVLIKQSHISEKLWKSCHVQGYGIVCNNLANGARKI